MISSLSQFAGERKKTINYTSYLDKVVTISVRDVGKNTISALQEAVGAATYFVISLDLFQYVSIVEIKWI